MVTALYDDFLMIFSSSIGLCVDDVDNDNGFTDAVSFEISWNFKHLDFFLWDH
jgi:hypothetical protein